MTMQPAQAAKRVGMSEVDLRSVNAIPPRVTIKAGSTLLVPRSADMEADVAAQVAENGQLALSREAVTKRIVVKAGKNDTVASIAKRYHVSAANVAEWNKVALGASFAAGQKVELLTVVQARSSGRSGKSSVRKSSGKNTKSATRKGHKSGKPAAH